MYNGEGCLVAAFTIADASKYALNVGRFTSGLYTLVIVLSDGRSITKAFLKQ